MRDKKMFVLKIVWRKSIASLHFLTQDVQHAKALTYEARRGTLPDYVLDLPVLI